MPDPFVSLVDSLPKSQREAYGFLRGLVNREPTLSANQMLNQLADGGLKIRRQTGLDIIAVLKKKADVPQFIRTFGENAIFPPSLHTVGLTEFRSGHKVVYEVGTNSANPLTPPSIYVGSQAPLSANQIYGAATAQFTLAQVNSGVVGDLAEVTFTIDDARYAPGEETTGEFTPPPPTPTGFESFEPSGIEAGITKAYNQALADLKAGRITGPEFFKRTRGL